VTYPSCSRKTTEEHCTVAFADRPLLFDSGNEAISGNIRTGRSYRRYLDTSNRTQNQDGTIKHTKGTFDFDCKIDVSCKGIMRKRIDQLNPD
jgi:hypothetical protein